MTEQYYDFGKHSYMQYKNDKLAHFLYTLIQGHLKNAPRAAIELGAGMGRFSAPVIEHFTEVQLVEPGAAYATHLRDRFRETNVSVIEASAQDFLRTADKTISYAVFCYHLMHHIHPADRMIIYQFVKETGSLGILVEPNPINPLILLQVLVHPDMSLSEEHQYLRLGKIAYKREIEKVGLAIHAYKRICILPPFVLNILVQYRIEGLLRSLEALNYLLPFISSYQLVVYGAQDAIPTESVDG